MFISKKNKSKKNINIFDKPKKSLSNILAEVIMIILIASSIVLPVFYLFYTLFTL